VVRSPRNRFPVGRHPCKRLSRRKHSSPDARSGERATLVPELAARICALAGGCLLSAEADIHSLSRAREGRRRRLSLCSLPVLQQFEESLGSLISVAQSATARTWQTAPCVIHRVRSSLTPERLHRIDGGGVAGWD